VALANGIQKYLRENNRTIIKHRKPFSVKKKNNNKKKWSKTKLKI
jgi:hypothetical protein